MDRRTLVAAAVALLAVTAIPVGAAADRASAANSSAAAAQGSNPCVGTITEQPETTTLFSIQGARGSDKTVAMTVGVQPDGEVIGVHNDTDHGRWWAYDVDRLPNGNLLQATTEPGITVIEEVDPATGEHVSVRRFEGVHDTHDVDLINGDELVMNDMGDGHNRLLVYNLTREEIVWEYRFDEHQDLWPTAGGGEYEEDWTHNNDVEQIEDGVFMVSIRNFDAVAAINRSTKEMEWQLGADDETDVLFEQHNPDYLESEDGRDSVLVADSRNDRVVEYERVGGEGRDAEWERTWVLRGGGLSEPRDADRLPNGNTLVADRRGDRIVEVTPEGEVVWEFYAPWQPYDVERIGTGDESAGGPTASELGAEGVYGMTGSAGFGEGEIEACYEFLTGVDERRLLANDELQGTPVETPTDEDDPTDTDDGAGTGTDTSVLGTPDDGGPNAVLLAGVAVLLAVLVAGVAFWRRR